MRGAPPYLPPQDIHHGIIPAYAGSTAKHYTNKPWQTDHPRVCGEHLPKLFLVAFCVGSSPRMRGALLGRTTEAEVDGIIPAYAGSTRTILVADDGRRDHPRVCGEHPWLTERCVVF